MATSRLMGIDGVPDSVRPEQAHEPGAIGGKGRMRTGDRLAPPERGCLPLDAEPPSYDPLGTCDGQDALGALDGGVPKGRVVNERA